jgi:hypothetical protein
MEEPRAALRRAGNQEVAGGELARDPERRVGERHEHAHRDRARWEDAPEELVAREDGEHERERREERAEERERVDAGGAGHERSPELERRPRVERARR